MRVTLYGILAATVAFATGCSDHDAVAPSIRPASTHATATVDPNGTAVSRQIDQYVWISCANGGAGETFRVSGELRYNFQSMRDSAGTYHLNVKSNTSDLTAVGLATGTFFRASMAERINSRAEDYLNMDVRIADLIRFVAPGSGESASLIATTHIIVDQGNYVLWDQDWSEVCR